MSGSTNETVIDQVIHVYHYLVKKNDDKSYSKSHIIASSISKCLEQTWVAVFALVVCDFLTTV